MRKSVLLAGSLAFLLTACGSPVPQPDQFDTQTYSQSSDDEDCDAGDMMEGDSDCYGVDLKSKKKKAKKKASSYYSSSKPKKSYSSYSSKKSSYGSSRSSSRSSSRRSR